MDSTFVDIILARSEQEPNTVIYNFLDSHTAVKESLTYSQLQKYINSLGNLLQQFTEPGDRCAIYCDSDYYFIIAFFTCLYLGRIAVPVEASHHSGLQRLRHIIQDCTPTVLLTDKPEILFDDQELARRAKIIDIKSAIKDDVDLLLPCAEVKPESIAFLQYTSGSTALPKGVKISHENLLHNSLIIKDKFQHHHNSVGVIWLPPFHDMGLIGGILQPYYANFPVYLMSPLLFIQRPLRWLQAITTYKGTTSGGPNFAYHHAFQRIHEEDLNDINLESWDLAFCGAEPINSQTLQNFFNKFSACKFNIKSFYPCYGMAESTLIITGINKGETATLLSVDKHELAHNRVKQTTEGEIRVLVGCGFPYVGSDIKIVDPESFKLCQDLQIGEIWVNSKSVGMGYWHNPELTRNTFHAVHSRDDKNYLRTGDLGFLYNKELFITGRYKELIIINGKNYYPQDIEACIQHNETYLQHNAGAAFGVTAEDTEQLVVFQEILRSVKPEQYAELITHIRSKISAEFDLAVDTIVLLPQGSIPKTSSGKIKRRYCRELYIANELSKLSPLFTYSRSEGI